MITIDFMKGSIEIDMKVLSVMSAIDCFGCGDTDGGGRG